MVAEIAGDFDAEFWAEHEGKTYRLCLEAEISRMSFENTNGCVLPRCSGLAMSNMSLTQGTIHWSLSDYKGDIEKQKDSGKAEKLDELEKSIVANIANDISVGVKGETVNLVITKELL